MLLSFSANAQKFPELDKSPMDVASFPNDYKESNKLIKITYSRPQLKDRNVQKLIPSGEVWRTGANEAAELTLYQDMMFGDTMVPAGTYTFYILNQNGLWTGIISKDVNVWGSYFYKKDNDVARFDVKVADVKNSIEAFSIVFESTEDGAIMHLGWSTLRAAFPFKRG